VGMRTGVRFHPHMIRTIWASECLEATKDVTLAATMLGDTPAIVMKTYAHSALWADSSTFTPCSGTGSWGS